MKTKYIEGKDAGNKFKQAMTAIFKLSKDEVPRPQPKKRVKRSKSDGKD